MLPNCLALDTMCKHYHAVFQNADHSFLTPSHHLKVLAKPLTQVSLAQMTVVTSHNVG
ncbi:hypothetical protein BgiMline_030447, partial [Biomphalaria glabrata]